MKKNYFAELFLLLAFIIMQVGCKKDLSTNKENTIPIESAQPSISNLKAWYSNQMNEQTNNLVGEKKPYYGIPDWENTKFWQKENTLVTALNVDNQKDSHFFLVTEANAAGAITNGKYVFVTIDEAHFKIMPKSSYDPNLLMGRYILSGATGVIIVHDINSNVISSLRFKNGTLDNTKTDKLVYKNIKKSNTNFTGGGATNNIIDDPYGVECTDWYLNTYADGELISSVYVGTTCTGNPNDGSGGGSGGGGSPEVPIASSFNFVNVFAVKLSGSSGTNEDWTLEKRITINGMKFANNPEDNYYTTFASNNNCIYNNNNQAYGGLYGYPNSFVYCYVIGDNCTTISSLSEYNKKITSTSSAIVYYPNYHNQQGQITPLSVPYSNTKIARAQFDL